jgi:RNA polymerase sigma-70 factor (ECF subfamily)
MEDLQSTFLKAHEEHADALFRYGIFKVSDRELSRDLVQECFMKTWEYMARGNEVDNLKAFLYKTLNHLVIDHYRKKKAVSLDQMQDEGFDPGVDERSSMFDKIDGRYALELVNKLEHPYRDAVYMRYVENFSLREISDATGEAENTIAVHVHRGLKKLKELYGNQ